MKNKTNEKIKMLSHIEDFDSKKIIIILFLLVFLVKAPIMDVPYFDDAAFWYVSKGLMVEELNLNPIFRAKGIPPELQIDNNRLHPWLDKTISDFTHPPLFYMYLALIYKFTTGQVITHLAVILFAALAAIYTFKLGEKLYNKKVGLFSSLLLIFSAPFFSQAGRIYPEMGVTAFTLMTIYYFFEKDELKYNLSGSALVLFKEQGVLAIVGILIFILIKEKNKMNNLQKYVTPIYVIIGWYIFHYLATGLFIYYANISKQANIIGIIQNAIFYLKFIFIEQYRFLISAFFIYAFYKSNKKNKLNDFETISLIIIGLYIALFSWSNQGFIRHIIPVFPLFFLISTSKVFETKIIQPKFQLLIVTLLLILSLTTYYQNTDYNYEENMRYLSIIKVQEKALSQLVEINPQTTVWVDLYTYLDYGYPYVGYQENNLKLNLIPIDYLKFDDANTNFLANFNKGDLIVEHSFYMGEIRPDYNVINIIDKELIGEHYERNEFVKIYRVK